MVSVELLLVQRIRYDALELPTETVAHEFLDIHDRHIVFATEPVVFLAYLRTAKVATVPSWHLLSRAIILPKAIFEERLREVYFREFPISIQGSEGQVRGSEVRLFTMQGQCTCPSDP